MQIPDTLSLLFSRQVSKCSVVFLFINLIQMQRFNPETAVTDSPSKLIIVKDRNHICNQQANYL